MAAFGEKIAESFKRMTIETFLEGYHAGLKAGQSHPPCDTKKPCVFCRQKGEEQNAQ